MYVGMEKERKKGTTDTHKLDGRREEEKKEIANRFIVELGFYKSSTDFKANSGLSYPRSSGADTPNLFNVGRIS